MTTPLELHKGKRLGSLSTTIGKLRTSETSFDFFARFVKCKLKGQTSPEAGQNVSPQKLSFFFPDTLGDCESVAWCAFCSLLFPRRCLRTLAGSHRETCPDWTARCNVSVEEVLRKNIQLAFDAAARSLYKYYISRRRSASSTVYSECSFISPPPTAREAKCSLSNQRGYLQPGDNRSECKFNMFCP